MRLLNGLDALADLPPGAAVTVGNFDGMHRGHARLLSTARGLRDAGEASAVVVVTFEPHPRTVLRPESAPPRLTPVALKRGLLAAAGADALIELPPVPEVLDLTAEEFWAMLRDRVRPRHLVEGHSFRFGKGGRGTIEALARWCAADGVAMHVAEPLEVVLLNLEIVPVASSLVRFLLGHGRVRDAAICLGRPYALSGPVVRGFQRGRTIGVPTANLQIEGQLVPADGVYAGRCAVDGVAYPAAVSLGRLPTFAENVFQIEAHLIGFSGDLYDRTLSVELTDWLRDQWKFDGVEPLKAQIARDIEATLSRADLAAAREIAPVAG